MFTVKLVEEGGHEQLTEATNLWVDVESSEKGSHRTLRYLNPNGMSGAFGDYGEVYVMNDHGATVAKYDLGMLNR
jgi:hypothetical protein